MFHKAILMVKVCGNIKEYRINEWNAYLYEIHKIIAGQTF